MSVIVGSPGTKSEVEFGGKTPLSLICGPCVIESRDHVLRHAEQIQQIAARVGLPLVFKASYDKANRTSLSGERGVGMEEGLAILAEAKRECGVPIVTDVHAASEVVSVSEVADLIQIPAFLCRQTDLLVAAGSSNKPVMIKKGQFLAPEDMAFAAEKVRSGGSQKVMLCERGACFGYRDLVVDFRSLEVMAANGDPVVFDATHSVQQMGGAGGASSGNRSYVPMLARAAVAAGVAGVFLESHEDPDSAPSDGANMYPLGQLEGLLQDLKAIAELSLQTRR